MSDESVNTIYVDEAAFDDANEVVISTGEWLMGAIEEFGCIVDRIADQAVEE